MIPKEIVTCELCTPINGKHAPECPLSEESLAKATTPPQQIPVLSGVPEAVEWMKQADAISAGKTYLTPDQVKDAANKEADANEAQIRLTQTEKGNISDQTQFKWKLWLGITGAVAAIGTIVSHFAGCF